MPVFPGCQVMLYRPFPVVSLLYFSTSGGGGILTVLTPISKEMICPGLLFASSSVILNLPIMMNCMKNLLHTASKEPFLTLITIPYGFRTQSIYTKQKQTVFIMLDIWPKLFLKNQA